jgi:hypothetical protein
MEGWPAAAAWAAVAMNGGSGACWWAGTAYTGRAATTGGMAAAFWAKGL